MNAVEPLKVNIPVYVDFSVGERFSARLDDNVLNKFASAYTTETLLALIGGWFRKYVNHKLQGVRDYYAAKVVEIGETEWLGKPVLVIRDGKDRTEAN